MATPVKKIAERKKLPVYCNQCELLMGGTHPETLSGLRSPDQTTSKTFAKLWPCLVQPLTGVAPFPWTVVGLVQAGYPQAGADSAALARGRDCLWVTGRGTAFVSS